MKTPSDEKKRKKIKELNLEKLLTVKTAVRGGLRDHGRDYGHIQIHGSDFNAVKGN